MRVIRKLNLVALLAVITLVTATASAGFLDGRLLPESNLYDGSTFYSESYTNSDGTTSYLRGRIDFAVYDTYSQGQVFSDLFENPGSGQYLYAYQIFNDFDGFSEMPVLSLSIFNPNGSSLGLYDSSITSQDFLTGGVNAENAFYSEDEKVVWEFRAPDKLLLVGEHSAFLIFSSDQNYVYGDYEITAFQNDPIPAPGEDDSGDSNPIPEPATALLLGICAASGLFKKKFA